MKKSKAKRDFRKSSKVTRLSPEKAAARDEGPRLIPLGPKKEQTPFQHYLELADAVLSPKKGR